MATKVKSKVAVAAKKPKVFWTTREKELVSIEIANRMMKSPGESTLHAVQEAQAKVLPAERQRAIKTVTMVKDVVSDAFKRFKKLQDEPAPPPQEPIDHSPFDPVNLSSLQSMALHADIGMAMTTLVEVFADAFATKVVDKFIQRMGELAPTTVDPNPLLKVATESLSAAMKRPARVKLPTIVVAGLKGHQITEVENEFRDKAQIKFWTVDENPHQLKVVCRDADYTIMMTKFISHSHEQTAKSAAGDRMLRVDGGISMLKSAINGLINTVH
ncbi:hypothetical protein RsoM2USA_250 [Ralstonia phage RsoM2USA]|nr:hypothetical protein RsoM2USA_250 [Ralstonia phage RsoM2USA]